MKTIFLSTAAVLASVALAAAQGGPNQPAEKPASGAASERAQPNAGGQGKSDQMPQRDSKPAEPQKGSQQAPRADQKDKAPASAERPRTDDAKRDAQQQSRDGDAQKAGGKRDTKQDAQTADPKQDNKRNQDRAGQGQHDPQRAQDQREQGNRDQRQDTNRQQGPTQQAPTAQQKDTQSGGRQDRVQADAQGRVTLNSEQRSRIQQTVFARADVPRVSRVDFNVTVGTTVPTHVTIVDVPPALIELNPEWRGYRYFVVEEEVIIVTPERRIVAVVPVGRSQAGSYGGTTVVELPEAEVRILQQVLVDRGFSVEVDGVWGPRTREALISFQRKEGLQVTGQIDTRTVTALGVQGRVNVQSDSRTNTGQQNQPAGQQQPTAQQPRGQQPAQQQGNQRPAADQEKTTGSGNAERNAQPDTPQRGSDSGKQPDPQRSGSPAGGEAPSRTEQRPGGAQKQ
jgi:hypothetical protein